jgi:peroxiredoxin
MELLRDRSDEFRAAGVQIYAISRDQPWTHVAWVQALDLNFPLLADFNGDATRGFDVNFDYRGLRDVSHRSAFLIDGEGVVQGSWMYGTAEVPDLDELLEAVRERL